MTDVTRSDAPAEPLDEATLVRLAIRGALDPIRRLASTPMPMNTGHLTQVVEAIEQAIAVFTHTAEHGFEQLRDRFEPQRAPDYTTQPGDKLPVGEPAGEGAVVGGGETPEPVSPAAAAPEPLDATPGYTEVPPPPGAAGESEALKESADLNGLPPAPLSEGLPPPTSDAVANGVPAAETTLDGGFMPDVVLAPKEAELAENLSGGQFVEHSAMTLANTSADPTATPQSRVDSAAPVVPVLNPES